MPTVSGTLVRPLVRVNFIKNLKQHDRPQGNNGCECLHTIFLKAKTGHSMNLIMASLLLDYWPFLLVYDVEKFPLLQWNSLSK